jgi:hypothetical protein
LPETDVHRVLLWANKRNVPEFSDEYRIEVDVAPVSITIFECRPPWRPGALATPIGSYGRVVVPAQSLFEGAGDA